MIGPSIPELCCALVVPVGGRSGQSVRGKNSAAHAVVSERTSSGNRSGPSLTTVLDRAAIALLSWFAFGCWLVAGWLLNPSGRRSGSRSWASPFRNRLICCSLHARARNRNEQAENASRLLLKLLSEGHCWSKPSKIWEARPVLHMWRDAATSICTRADSPNGLQRKCTLWPVPREKFD
jgi:hypothetical protein